MRFAILALFALAAFGQPQPTAPLVWKGRGNTLPATCVANRDLWWKSNATAGQNIYGCTSTNTWTLQSGSSSGVAGLTVNGDTSVNASVALTNATPTTPTWNAAGTTNCDEALSNDCNPTAIATSGTTLGILHPHYGHFRIKFTQSASPVTTSIVTYPANVKNCPQPSPTASKTTQIELFYDGTNFWCPGSDDALDTPVTGPASSTLNDCAAFADTTGKVIKDVACPGGGGLTMSTANLGLVILPVPTASVAQATTFNDNHTTPEYYQFILRDTFKFTTIAFEPSSAAATATGIAIALYDSTCAKVTNGDATSITINNLTNVNVPLTFATPPTLSPGVYYVGWATDNAAFNPYQLSSLGVVYNTLANNGGAFRVFKGSNAATGSNTTLAMPATCGTKTADNSNPPMLLVAEP